MNEKILLIKEREEVFHQLASGLFNEYEKFKKMIPLYNKIYTRGVYSNEQFIECLQTCSLRELAAWTIEHPNELYPSVVAIKQKTGVLECTSEKRQKRLQNDDLINSLSINNKNHQLDDFKKGKLAVRMRTVEEQKQFSTICGITLNIKFSFSQLQMENGDTILCYNVDKKELKKIEKETSLEVVEANIFNKSCALKILNNTAITNPLDQYYLVSALSPISDVQDGYYIDSILNNISNVEDAKKIYYSCKEAYLKTDDNISLDRIIDDVVIAICDHKITKEEVTNMAPRSLISNVLEDFRMFDQEKNLELLISGLAEEYF